MATLQKGKKIVRIGMDIAKNVFQLHGVDKDHNCIMKKRLKRNEVLTYFANITPCTVALESCGGSHYWARELIKIGHTVKLIAAQHVKPYVQSQKNDKIDAEAICEAASRPKMRFVTPKSVIQQEIQMLHKLRTQKVKRRTAVVAEIHSFLQEFGIVTPKGLANIRNNLPIILEEQREMLSPFTIDLFQQLYSDLLLLNDEITQMDKEIKKVAKNNDICKKLMVIPGIGEITATYLYASVGNGYQFKNGRMMAAWIGLVPKQNSSGGRTKLGAITKKGNKVLRALLVHCGRALIRVCDKKEDRFSKWLQELKYRKGSNLTCVACANKIARISWNILAKNEEYKMAV